MTKASQRPHLLLITADQMRWDAIGCSGNSSIQTPTLDRLAERGIRFTNAFTPNPICVPARASIMTGNYPQVCTGKKVNGGSVKADQPLLTHVLKKAGYRCYAEGKLHFNPYSAPGMPRHLLGFDEVDLHESGRILEAFDPEGKLRGLEDYFDYLTDVNWHGYARAHGTGNNDVRPCASPLPQEHYVDHWIADCTINRINQHVENEAEKPFFLWMSSPKPHSPYDPPRPYDQLYDPRSLPTPFGSASDLADRYARIDLARYKHGLTSLSPEAWQVIRSYYYGNVTFLDAMIGRVVNHLEKMNLLENTLILFTSDHGDLLGDFGSSFKLNHLNGSVRVPFLAAGPGIPSNVVCDELVGLQDLLPTFSDFAGVAIEKPVQGLSLAPLLLGKEDFPRDEYYSTTESECGCSVMLVTKQWKYIYSEANATEELYDQENDIQELHNLAHQQTYRSIREEMKRKLMAAAREFHDDSIFEGNQLKVKEMNREEFKKVKPSALGWRFY